MNGRSAASHPVSSGGDVLPGILVGLMPLVLFALLGIFTVLATTLARALTAGEAFLAQQPIVVGTFGIGVLVAFVGWIAGCAWALRRARAWESTGASLQAISTLWTLGSSTIFLLLPVLLAVLIPQHPAHPAP